MGLGYQQVVGLKHTLYPFVLIRKFCAHWQSQSRTALDGPIACGVDPCQRAAAARAQFSGCSEHLLNLLAEYSAWHAESVLPRVVATLLQVKLTVHCRDNQNDEPLANRERFIVASRHSPGQVPGIT